MKSDFSTSLKPWARAYYSKAYEQALVELHTLMARCVSPEDMRLYLEAERLTRARASGRMPTFTCDFCHGSLPERGGVIGQANICPNCLGPAKEYLTGGLLAPGWYAPPGDARSREAAATSCGLCGDKPVGDRLLVGTGSAYICYNCACRVSHRSRKQSLARRIARRLGRP